MEPQLEERPKAECSPTPSSVFSVLKLIIKLRWAGMDGEAERFESMAMALPSEARCSMSFGPFSTD